MYRQASPLGGQKAYLLGYSQSLKGSENIPDRCRSIRVAMLGRCFKFHICQYNFLFRISLQDVP